MTDYGVINEEWIRKATLTRWSFFWKSLMFWKYRLVKITIRDEESGGKLKKYKMLEEI